MSVLTKISIFFSFLFLVSCEKNNKNNVQKYFNFGDVLIEQTRVLEKANPIVKKQVSYNGKVEISNDTINWKKELEQFWKFDLSKSKFVGAFRVDTIHTGKHYFDKVDDLPTEEFYFYNYYPISEDNEIKKYVLATDSIGRIHHLEILTEEHNMFYSNIRHYDFEFTIYSNTFPILKYFETIQTKKILFFDKEEFKLRAELNSLQ